MSGICGWVSKSEEQASDAIEVMASSLVCNNDVLVRINRTHRAAIALAHRRNDADLHASGQLLVAVCGRPRFAEPDLRDIASGQGPALALATAYRRHGARLVESVLGSFSFFLFDGSTGKGLLAVDRLGINSLFYEVVAGTLVFGSRLATVGKYPGADNSVRHQSILDYVHFHMVPGPNTIYGTRKRLLPGNLLSWENGNVQINPYWSIRFSEDESRPFRELRDEFVGLLAKSVAEASEGTQIGAFLSGGTDSSTIAGMIAQCTGQPARTYSIGFDADGYDEMRYARIAAKHFKTSHHEYYVTPSDVVKAIPLVASIHDQPFGNASAIPAYYCAKLAKEDGVEILLAGDGGDELFGGNERYATQYLYSLYSNLPRIVREGLVEPLIFRLPAIGIIGKSQRYVRHASAPMPARYDNYNLLLRFGARNVFTDEFLLSVDPEAPSEDVSHAYNEIKAQSLTNRMLGLDLKYTLADNDLPKVIRSCDLADVEVRFPFLNDALVAFAAHLPPKLKVRRTKLRYFFKEALRGFLPVEIIAKAKHGFGLPVGRWMQSHSGLREVTLSNLASLRARNIVRPQFLDQLIGGRMHEHMDYYGSMVWTLLMLEQWFVEHQTPHRGVSSRETAYAS